jgi:hypothetical protein
MITFESAGFRAGAGVADGMVEDEAEESVEVAGAELEVSVVAGEGEVDVDATGVAAGAAVGAGVEEGTLVEIRSMPSTLNFTRSSRKCSSICARAMVK